MTVGEYCASGSEEDEHVAADGRVLGDGGLVDARSITTALLRAIGRSLAAAGSFWIYVPVPDDLWREPTLPGPPPGHPERLRPDIPLSAVERHLARSLSHSEDTA
ncbi:DUF6059 family protein [Streptomyces collinus]|uniref:DUF6059 family protein n=1 Tax=Streptomyces collinus TaxID=42684 RepID=UPI00332095E0